MKTEMSLSFILCECSFVPFQGWTGSCRLIWHWPLHLLRLISLSLSLSLSLFLVIYIMYTHFHVIFILAASLPSRSRHFQTWPLRGWAWFKTDLHKWHPDKFLPHLVFYISLSVRMLLCRTQNLLIFILHTVLSIHTK